MRLDWRAWLESLGRLWRGSLQVRTVALTVLLSTIAVTAIGFYILTSVRTNLFESRRDQLVSEAERAVLAARDEFTNVGGRDLDAVQFDAFEAIQSTVSTGPSIGMFRAPGQSGPAVMDTLYVGALSRIALSDGFTRSLVDGGEGRLSWQSIAIPAETGDGAASPGLAFGSLVDVPQAGRYELVIVYDLSDLQRTLDFVAGTLVAGGAALIVLIAIVSYVVVRLVVGPVRRAAATSEKLAAGRLEERLAERGDDELATLARSFNRMADSLQSQIRRLAELSRLQQRFVSDVSHELRTPLTTIRLAGDVLYDRREDFPPATARTAELLHDQVQRFETLLADLLEMSRYDAGAVELETEPTNLVRLVEDVMESVRPLAEERGTELRIVAPGGYFEVEVDARRIRRIVQNLLGNAIDHGEGRPVIVYVDSDASSVAIAVRDYGVGLEPAQLERVFDRFWRADPSRQRRTGGTGLGLAISQEDAGLHGGEIDVWSEPGRGSCFRLTLPRVPGDGLRSRPLDLPPDDAIELQEADPADAEPSETDAEARA